MKLKQRLELYIARKDAERKRPRSAEEMEARATHAYLITCLVLIMLVFFTIPAHAATPPGGDPIATINNLSTFIFSAIRAIGIIILGFGIVQIGLSLKSHDASQRANGFLTFFGGVVITFAKNILDLVVGA